MNEQLADEKPTRRRQTARLVWASKPRRAPNPRDLEFQTAEIVIPNVERDEKQLGLLNRADPAPSQGQGQVSLADVGVDPRVMNRLIWGDNLLVMQALLAQGYEGKIDLIYIDPPFKSDDDYSYHVALPAHQSVTRMPSMLERMAYRDTWAGGVESYLDMLYPRLQLMRRLLSEKGSIYVHIGADVAAYVRIVLDEIFGSDRLRAEIIWQSVTAHNDAKAWGMVHQYIYHYAKGDEIVFERQYGTFDDSYIASHYSGEDPDGRKYQLDNLTSPNPRPNLTYEWKGYPPPAKGWRYSRETMAKLDGQGLIWYPDDKSKRPRLKRYLSDKGVRIQSIWDDIPPVNSQAKEDTGFDTQKPEKLLQRIVSASSGADDLVADFFVGSGSTAVVAEKLGRRWLAVDFGKVGIQVTRTRLVEADARPFVLQNLGNYQRETIYLGGSRIGEVQRVILKLYGATPRQQQPELGVREQDGALTLVYVGYPDRPVTARKVEEMALLAAKLDGLGYKRLVVLGWDYEFNYSEILKAREKARGAFPVAIESRVIPPEVYEHLRKAKDEDDLEKLSGKILFHEKPYLRLSPVERRDVGPHEEELTVSLGRYVVFDYPVSSEEERVRLQELAKENFHALIEYWAVDWDYDGVTFRSSQQSFRGFKQSKNPAQKQLVARSLASRVPRKSARLIVVRVVDIFGNDASASADVKGVG